MKSAILLATISIAAFHAYGADTAAEAGLAAVTDLGQLNGRALACAEKGTSSRAKNLILLHAPKTPRYGDAFEQATQKGFLAQVKETAACPDAAAFEAQIDRIAGTLRENLPAVSPR